MSSIHENLALYSQSYAHASDPEGRDGVDGWSCALWLCPDGGIWQECGSITGATAEEARQRATIWVQRWNAGQAVCAAKAASDPVIERMARYAYSQFCLRGMEAKLPWERLDMDQRARFLTEARNLLWSGYEGIQ